MKQVLQTLSLLVAILVTGSALAQGASGELRISVTPAAFLSVDHQPARQGERFTEVVPAGKDLLLKVSKPGYVTEYRTVRVGAGVTKDETFTLKRQEIPVLFRSNVPATLLLDGAVLGGTPCYHFFKQPRIYQIEVVAEGYQAQKFHLNLTDGKPQVKTFDLTSNSGTLTITSDPAGAQVILNGLERGVTPCTIERLREDTYTLLLKKENYNTETRTIKIMAGDAAEVALTLKKQLATLKLTSTPADAQVYVDGFFRGKTPLTLTNLEAGAHHIRLKKDGYSEDAKSLLLEPGSSTEETFSLEVIFGSLSVQTEPATVDVYNGYEKLFSTAPRLTSDYRSARKTHSLAPGTYTLTFKANGYAPRTQEVTISPEKTTTLPLIKLEFRPNFKIRTTSGILTGVWVSKEANGDIRLETQPGIIKRVPHNEIISAAAIVE